MKKKKKSFLYNPQGFILFERKFLFSFFSFFQQVLFTTYIRTNINKFLSNEQARALGRCFTRLSAIQLLISFTIICTKFSVNKRINKRDENYTYFGHSVAALPRLRIRKLDYTVLTNHPTPQPPCRRHPS